MRADICDPESPSHHIHSAYNCFYDLYPKVRENTPGHGERKQRGYVGYDVNVDVEYGYSAMAHHGKRIIV
jgi:hypothetical protein